MKITRNGQTFELTRQELFEANQEYEYILAKEVMSERLIAHFGKESISDELTEAAIEVYLDNKTCGCDEDFCIAQALERADTIAIQKQ